MSEPRWLTREIVVVLHAELLAEHGGPAGLRDEGALKSALARPQQKHHYEAQDIVTLAAAYAYGFCRNHPFVDGNKRVSLACLDVFLRLNGHALAASEVEAVTAIRDLAAGDVSEDELVAWIRENTERL